MERVRWMWKVGRWVAESAEERGGWTDGVWMEMEVDMKDSAIEK